MRLPFVLRYMKEDRTPLLIFLLFLTSRIVESFFVKDEFLVGVRAEEGFDIVNSLSIASFVYVPIFCFYIAKSTRYILSDALIVSHKTRESVIFRFISLTVLQSALYSLIIIVSTLPLGFTNFTFTIEFIPFIFLSFFLQTIFFSVCALIFLFTFLTTRMMPIAFIATVTYGLWDFMASNVVGGGVAFIGWTKTYISVPLAAGQILHNFSFLMVLFCALCFGCFTAIAHIDFLKKRA